MRNLWLAFSFLTTIPMPTVPFVNGGLGRAGKWFPLVGLVLGLILAGGHWALMLLFSPGVTAVLTLILWAWLTGGLHLDGLADCGDGLLVTASRERRLEILRDSRLGAFGAISLVLFLLAKGTAVAALPFPSFALILAPVMARWLILLAARQPSARPGGLGDAFAAAVTPASLALAAIIPIALLVVGGWQAVLAVGLASFMTWLILRFARHRLGGVTGDVFGLVVEMSELTVLLVYAAQL